MKKTSVGRWTLAATILVGPAIAAVMGAVDAHHAGVASGVNNAVARVAGLLAIAVFGVVLTRTLEARVTPGLDQLRLPSPTRQALDRELRAAFRRVLLGAALLALGLRNCRLGASSRPEAARRPIMCCGRVAVTIVFSRLRGNKTQRP